MLGKKHGLILLISFFFFLVYSALSIFKHLHFDSHAFDLGIFDQAIWHYSRFELPTSTIRGFENLLGDHFHPILILAAPLFWIWNDTRMLLLLQAALIAGSGIPVFLVAKQFFGRASAAFWTIAYYLFWGLQNAVAYDFHEIAFAVPLIAWGCYFVINKKWGFAAISVLPLLLVKEDLTFLVASFGIVFLLDRQWRLGVLLALSGGLWFLLVTKVLIPFINGGRKFGYWTYTQFGPDPFSAAATAFKRPLFVLENLFYPKAKLKTGFYFFAPFLFLPLLSPLIILAVPLVAERFLSTNQNYWFLDFHYTATLSPIVAIAGIDSLSRLSKIFKKRHMAEVASVAVMLISVYLLPRFPLSRLTQIDYWRLSQSDQIGQQMLEMIPDEASVVAQDTISPHLTHRKEIYELYPNSPRADYVAANFNLVHFPTSNLEYTAYLRSLREGGYDIVFSKGSWLLFAKKELGVNAMSLSPEASDFLE